MYTEKDIDNEFVSKKNEYPIWYYKTLEQISVDYVIFHLIQEQFVVKINKYNYKLVFGLNENGEMSACITYDECNPHHLSSYDVINQAFKDGTWYIISNKDTTEEFKSKYRIKVKTYKKQQLINDYKDILNSFIDKQDISEINKISHKQYIDSCNKEQLEKFIKQLFKKCEWGR